MPLHIRVCHVNQYALLLAASGKTLRTSGQEPGYEIADRMPPSDWEVVLDAGAKLGEGPVWRGESVSWVDIDLGSVHETDPDTGYDKVRHFGEPVGSAIPRLNGGLVTGMKNGVAFFDIDGVEERRVLIEVDDAQSRMNDAKCDPAGRLFTGTMTQDDRRSALYRIDPDGSVNSVFDGIGISNGLGWSPDGGLMYYVDSSTMRVDVIDYDPATGSVENRRPQVVFSEGGGIPDGLAVDSEGCLWIAFWDGWCVRRFDPDGALIRTVGLPVAHVTSCAFGGQQLDQLFVTSASAGLEDSVRPLQRLAGALFRVDPMVTGLPVSDFAG